MRIGHVSAGWFHHLWLTPLTCEWNDTLSLHQCGAINLNTVNIFLQWSYVQVTVSPEYSEQWYCDPRHQSLTPTVYNRTKPNRQSRVVLEFSMYFVEQQPWNCLDVADRHYLKFVNHRRSNHAWTLAKMSIVSWPLSTLSDRPDVHIWLTSRKYYGRLILDLSIDSLLWSTWRSNLKVCSGSPFSLSTLLNCNCVHYYIYRKAALSNRYHDQTIDSH